MFQLLATISLSLLSRFLLSSVLVTVHLRCAQKASLFVHVDPLCLQWDTPLAPSMWDYTARWRLQESLRPRWLVTPFGPFWMRQLAKWRHDTVQMSNWSGLRGKSGFFFISPCWWLARIPMGGTPDDEHGFYITLWAHTSGWSHGLNTDFCSNVLLKANCAGVIQVRLPEFTSELWLQQPLKHWATGSCKPVSVVMEVMWIPLLACWPRYITDL